MNRDKRRPMRTTAFQREHVRQAELGKRAAYLRSGAAALVRAGEMAAADRLVAEARRLHDELGALRE